MPCFTCGARRRIDRPVTDPLLHRRSLPPGGLVEMLPGADDGWPLRAMRWPGTGAAGARGSILFLNGRGDFIEKYAESYWHWRARGFGVSVFDWRGQGLSGRLGDDPLKGDCFGFDPWLADLDALIDWFMATQPPPWFAVAHSMGGHLLLRHLENRHVLNRGGEFTRAALLAPMIGIAGGRVAPAMLERLARSAVRMGLGPRFAPMQGGDAQSRRSPARQVILTSDVARFADEGWWVDQIPALALGGVTNRWLLHAFESTAALSAPGVIERIKTPMLVFTAEHERLVDNRMIASLEARMPDAILEPVLGAAHELLRERDRVRGAVLARLDSFLVA